MKKELKNILKYLVVYGILLVTPAALLAIVEVVADRMRGGTMNSDEVWNSPFMTSALLLGSLLIIAVFLWRRWATIGLGRIRRADVWSVVLCSILLFIGWYFPEDFLIGLFQVPSSIDDKEFSQMTGGVIGFLDTGIMAPIAEELLCRGAILAALLRIMPRWPWVAIVIQALIFGLVHLDPAQMVYCSLYGLLLGWLCWRTASLLPGIFVHIANNATVLVLPDCVDATYASMGVVSKTAVLVFSVLILAGGIWWFARKYPAVRS